MNADGSGQTRLTDHLAEDTSPSWSPDGRHIAFQSWRDGESEVYVMNADGSGQARLTDNPWWDGTPQLVGPERAGRADSHAHSNANPDALADRVRFEP